jgi:hypothetical protein
MIHSIDDQLISEAGNEVMEAGIADFEQISLILQEQEPIKSLEEISGVDFF